jgi:AraC-like DNA-binding protein
MDGPPEDFRQINFSTAELPAPQRKDGWQHVLSTKLLGVQVEQLGPTPFRAKAVLRIFEALRFGSGAFDPSIHRRDSRAVASDNDDVLLVVNLDNELTLEQRGRELTLQAGDACVLSCAEPSAFGRRALGHMRAARVPRAALAKQVPDLDDAGVRLIPRRSAMLDLLLDYLEAIDRRPTYLSQPLRELVTEHVYDLMSLLLGGADEGTDFAGGRGLKAARIGAVKGYITRNYMRRDLSIATVATRHHMSARSLQRLFEVEDSTFTDFLVEVRLGNVHRLLRHPRHAARSVSELALDCGFGDMSHFNHVFRKRFGAAPSDVRHEAGLR